MSINRLLPDFLRSPNSASTTPNLNQSGFSARLESPRTPKSTPPSTPPTEDTMATPAFPPVDGRTMADMYTIEKVQKIRYAHRLAAPDVFINELQNNPKLREEIADEIGIKYGDHKSQSADRKKAWEKMVIDELLRILNRNMMSWRGVTEIRTAPVLTSQISVPDNKTYNQNVSTGGSIYSLADYDGPGLKFPEGRQRNDRTASGGMINGQGNMGEGLGHGGQLRCKVKSVNRPTIGDRKPSSPF